MYIRDVEIRPNLVLAPMEGVTDLTFRRLVRQIGGCGMTVTEFIPAFGLVKDIAWCREAARFDEGEHPVAIQVYGKDPELLAEGARVAQGLGADVVDLNMGCPAKKVCAHSGGSALMKEPALAARIVAAIRAAVTVPFTVKMRSGWDPDHKNAPEVAWMCQEEGAEGITIHWRTRADRYGGQRQIDKITQTVQRVSVPVIGNGDIIDIPSALAMLTETGCDGVMLGRGAMRNPWSLLQIAQHLRGEAVTPVTASERKRALLAFLARFHETFRHERAALGRFKQIAKHFTEDLPQGTDFRRAILRSQSIDDIIALTDAFFSAWQPEALMPLSRPSGPPEAPAGPPQHAARSTTPSGAVVG